MATPYASGESVSAINYSGLSYIDGLLGGLKWGGALGSGVDLTYSFGGANSVYRSGYGNGEPLNGFGSLTSIQQTATNNALQAYANVANISFTEVQDSATVAGDLRFARSDAPSTAWAYYPNSAPEGGDIWFSNSAWYNTATPGTYGYMTFLHEIGHALGLEHPHSNNTALSIDTTRFSVMSYRSYEGAALTGYTQNFYATTPMLHDIAALQYSYGANMSYETGNNVYSWGVGERIFETVWDAGGNDTIDWSNQSSDAIINLNDGEYSQLGPSYWTGIGYESRTFAIAYNAVIENANGGSGDDTLIGNDVNNVLVGGAGDDTLIGGASDALGGTPVMGTDWRVMASGDFDGDGRSDDIFWWNQSDSRTHTWEVESTAYSDDTEVRGAISSNWRVSGVGDFDGDGIENDVFWRNQTDGSTSIWNIENGTFAGGGLVRGAISTNWRVSGVGDFDGDGVKNDILWWNPTNGYTGVWNIENNTFADGGSIRGAISTNWRVVGVGDFDGDGAENDILWWNPTNGYTGIWNIENNIFADGGSVRGAISTNWRAVGVGDFDGDGVNNDILWWNRSDGSTGAWNIENSIFADGGPLSGAWSLDWRVADVGDFNGDGSDNDVLWRNEADGSTEVWNIVNGAVASKSSVEQSSNSDILTGGTGDDQFVFNDGDGANIVTDFVAGAGTDDVIDIADFNFSDFNAAIAVATDNGFDTTITLDANDSVTLIGVRVADLHQDDFALV